MEEVGDFAAVYLVLARSTAARFTSLLDRLPRVTGPSVKECVREKESSVRKENAGVSGVEEIGVEK